MLRSKLKTATLALTITILALSLIAFPKEAVTASKKGLEMWWEIVFPSLLPFFIICEILICFGVVGFLGVILEPFMRPLFKVPGVGGFVWAMGMASGFPTGARLTARLRLEGQLTKVEAERLVSFTNTSNPLFIFGAVAAVFFENPQLGLILALSHYLGNVGIGLLMRFYGKEKELQPIGKMRNFSIKYAFAVLHQTRLKESRPIGKLLGDAVISSINTLLMVGGFIILFSVINELLFQLHIMTYIGKIVKYILDFFHLPVKLTIPFISGLMEITMGSHLTSQIKGVDLMYQAIIVSFILAFSGFSVQAQVASILAQTDINFKPFFIARIIHGFLASLLTYVLWKPFYNKFYSINTSNVLSTAFIESGEKLYKDYIEIMKVGPIITIVSLMIYILIFIKQMKEEI